MHEQIPQEKEKVDKKIKVTDKTIFQGKTYRITVLSERLLRFEYNLNGQFLDLPTEFAVNRNFPNPAFKLTLKTLELNLCL